jgi:hypothetical protein
VSLPSVADRSVQPPVFPPPTSRPPVLMIVEDCDTLSCAALGLCASLGVKVTSVRNPDRFPDLLVKLCPIAVLAVLDGAGQDGCHVMMRVADYAPELPLLLITGRNPAFIGAAEAVKELWRLSVVRMVPELPSPGELAEFVCSALRSAGQLPATDPQRARSAADPAARARDSVLDPDDSDDLGRPLGATRGLRVVVGLGEDAVRGGRVNSDRSISGRSA